uniref:KiSS-1 metastasis suppressor n=1 Tax=Leptobrachium leishanense TaxID=445787 RepID=A0A8C5M3T4_9ANUR
MAQCTVGALLLNREWIKTMTDRWAERAEQLTPGLQPRNTNTDQGLHRITHIYGTGDWAGNVERDNSVETIILINSKGEESSLMPVQSQWLSSLPCPEMMPSMLKMEQTPMLALLCRSKKLYPPSQIWSEDSPVPNRVIPAPEGALLVEREKDLSTYNWNSFGLRYGKRQNGAVNSKVKIWQ